MMEQVFRTLLNMSYTGSIVILAVLALRAFLKAVKAPAWIAYALWGVALFRLLCPFSFESALALLPSAAPIPQGFTTAQQPAIHTGFELLNAYVNPALSESLAPASPAASANPAQILFFIGGVVWLLGAAAVLLSGALSALKLKNGLRFAVLAQDGVYESEGLSTAFVWGVFRPRVYLPAGLGEQSRAHILLHEKTHLRRFDHIAKLLFFLAAAAHWFNPLAWLAFRLFEKDMELSCDESVLSRAKEDIRKPYSETLLAVSARRARGFSPISFGEGSVKSRIKSALSYKKPALWVVVGAVVFAAALGVTLALNPPGAAKGTLTSKGTPMEALLSSRLVEGGEYAYRVNGSIKSIVFYTAVYDKTSNPLSKILSSDPPGAAARSNTVPLYASVSATIVDVTEREGTFSVIYPQHLRGYLERGAVSIYAKPASQADAKPILGTGYTMDAVAPPTDYTASASAWLAAEDMPIKAEQPIPLYVRVFGGEENITPPSPQALAKDLTLLYGYDYVAMVYCVFSEKTAAELAAEYAPSMASIDFVEGGKVTARVPIIGKEDVETVKKAIMGHLVRSSAWPAEDMKNYPDRIDVYVRLDDLFPPGDATERDPEFITCHVFLKDERPCIQLGNTGMWTFMIDGNYEALLAFRPE